MALNQALLKSELLKLFDETDPGFAGWPTTIVQAATNFANAYDKYAIQAQDASGEPPLSVNKAGFETALMSIPVPEVGTAAVSANIFDQAFLAYWTGGSFTFGIPPPTGVGGTGIFSVELSSVVLSVTPSVLGNLLLPIFSTYSAFAEPQADAIASAFHTATTTAVVVIITGLDTTPPPTGPLPITNTGTIS